jgi:hypothetical protein
MELVHQEAGDRGVEEVSGVEAEVQAGWEVTSRVQVLVEVVFVLSVVPG